MLTTIIANHWSQAGKLLLKVAQDEWEPKKIQLLLSALTLVQHEPAGYHTSWTRWLVVLERNKLEAESVVVLPASAFRFIQGLS